MTTRFDQLGAEYMVSPLLGMHGEDVVYRPKGQPARTIKAIVTRDRDDDGPFALIEVHVDATHGITMDELDRGDDQIDVRFERSTDPFTRRKIENFGNEVGGMVTLEVR